MHKFLPILFFSCAVLCAGAQTGRQPVQDSLQVVDQQISPAGNGGDKGSVQQETDTTLYFNKLSISPDSIIAWKKLQAFEYASYLDSLLRERQKKQSIRKNEDLPSGPGWLDNVFNSPVTRVFFWILAGLFILFILYRLFLTEGMFRKRTSTGNVLAPEVTEEHLSGETDFDHLISQAIKSGDFRLAVRYQYLKTLRGLAERQFIELAGDKTNYQYVREISNSAYQNDFASLTLSYEYVWYGEFNIDNGVYQTISARFTGFNQKILPGN
jgi:hypothetical protein